MLGAAAVVLVSSEFCNFRRGHGARMPARLQLHALKSSGTSASSGTAGDAGKVLHKEEKVEKTREVGTVVDA